MNSRDNTMDFEQLDRIILKYKEEFETIHGEEIYKWRAVKCFQENWDINAENFSEMLNSALHKSSNLLASQNFYPKKMMLFFADKEPEKVRNMFRNLYNENIPVKERIENFISASNDIFEKYKERSMRSHYQSTNSISVYLFFRYPNRYYLFKYRKFKDFAEKIGYAERPRKGKAENVQKYFDMCDKLCEYLNDDAALIEMNRKRLGVEDYEDEKLHLLVDDIVFGGSGYNKKHEKWEPSDSEYNPGITFEKWIELIEDRDVFDENALMIMKRILDYGGEATCKQLSQRYGGKPNFYNAGSSSLGKRIHKKTNCPVMDRKNYKWWTVLYQGKSVGKDEEGSYAWRLRQELKRALEEFDLSQVPLYFPGWKVENGEEDQNTKADVELVEPYGKEEFLLEVYMDEDEYDKLVSLLKRKKNIILQGAPGVGKTFAAKRLAYSMLGGIDCGKVKMVQFHQNYSYEDFIIGYKPDGEGFKLQTGIFYEFCQKAKEDPTGKYFFIIDEINRGNISKILGELLMLIENDYRGEEMALAYGGLSFYVPQNVYIIGMMNTADRSLAMIDYALRRRFSFFEMYPAFDKELFKDHQKGLDDRNLDRLIKQVKDLNWAIASDESLGEGFCIGHSYFCSKGKSTDGLAEEIVEYDIIPMLKEYWFDDNSKLEIWTNRLRGAIND